MPPGLSREYPHIRFAKRWDLLPKTWRELGQCEAIAAAMAVAPLRPEEHRRLLLVSFRKGAQATTAIEGNTLTDEEVASVDRGARLAPSKEYQAAEVKNVLDAMNELRDELIRHNTDALVTSDLLRRFHQMVGKGLGEHFDAIPGRFREDTRVVGPYRCPAPQDVPPLVDSLAGWLVTEFGYSSGQQAMVEAIVEAVVAHVYTEWIHPFGDGNGRTGRLVEFYVLLRAGLPDVASHILSNFYNQTRPEYYRQLQRAKETTDLSDFIAYAVQGLRDGLQAQFDSILAGQFATAWRSYIYDKFSEEKARKTIFKRRRDLVLAMADGKAYESGDLKLINPSVARYYAGVSDRTLKRDLAALSALGLVVTEGGRYLANTRSLRELRPARRHRSS